MADIPLPPTPAIADWMTYRNWYNSFIANPSAAGPPPPPAEMPPTSPQPIDTPRIFNPTESTPTIHAPRPQPPRSPFSLSRFNTPRRLVSPVVNIPRHRPLPTPPVNTENPSLGKSIAAKPDMFDGDKSKYVQWARTVSVYLAGFSREPTEKQKILIMLSYMRGNNAAGRFADLLVMGDDFSTLTLDLFMKKMDENFKPVALARNAEKKLLSLRQNKESTEDFIVMMKQLIIEAEYNINTHSRLLINILRNGVKNEIVEFVERSQPALIESTSYLDWERAIIKADQTLAEINDRKRRSGFTSSFFRPKPSSSTPSNPTSSSSFTPSSVHPNQPGTFGAQGGVPMDISKARAEGKCFKCGGPWPCKEHARPQRKMRMLEFKGAKIFYQSAEELAAAIKTVERNEQGFGNEQ